MSETTTIRDNERTVIVVYFAKSVFELALSMRPGQVRQRRRLSRGAQWPREAPSSR